MAHTKIWLRNLFRGDNQKRTKARVVFPACNTPTRTNIRSYQLLSKYLKQYGSYGQQKSLASGDIIHNEESGSCLSWI